MTEAEERAELLRRLRIEAQAGSLDAKRTLKRIERDRRQRIESINGHRIPNGPKGTSLFLNRKERRRRLGL